MGRNKWSYRQVVEDCESIDIFWLKRNGFLCGYASGTLKWNYSNGRTNTVGVIARVQKTLAPDDYYMQLRYTMTDSRTSEKTAYDYRVEIVSTPCHFGGFRYWFICPLITNGIPCRKRVAKLYFPPGAKYFGCRHCYNLAHRSVKEHDKRVDRLADNIDLLEAVAQSGNFRKYGLVLSAIDKRKKRWQRVKKKFKFLSE